MTRHGILFTLWLVATVALLLVSSACGPKPDPTAPKPVSAAYWCVSASQTTGDTSVFCTENEALCILAQTKAEAEADSATSVLGLDGVGTCTKVNLGMAVAKE